MFSFLDTKEKKRQFIISYGVFVINGMLALSIGSLLPFVRDARGLDYAFCGLLVSLHSLGNLVSSFAAGLLPIWIGRKKTILIFNSFFAVSFLLLTAGGSRACLAAAFLLTGLARGATSNFNNKTINNLAPGKAWTINGLHAMFSIGAFLFPLLLTFLTAGNAGNWIYAGYFMVFMGALSWILYFLLPVEKEDREKGEKKKAGFGFFREPLFFLCTGILFFYLCAEQGVIGWLITYFKDTGLLDPRLSQIMAGVLWIMILAGRLTAAWLSTRMKKERLLLLMGAGFLVFFLILLAGRSTGLIVFGIMGFGYSMAGIYPTTVSVAGLVIRRYELSWSFILTAASLGSIIMPSIVGGIAERAGIASGMGSIAVAVLIDLSLILVLKLYMSRKEA